MSRGRHLLPRLATVLRLLSSLALLVAAWLIFQQPLKTALAPWLGSAVADIESSGRSWWGSKSAPGFMLNVTSNPTAAEVWVNGALRTHTPAIANITCRDGEPVTIALKSSGSRDFERTLACREGGSLRMRIRLEPP